MVWPRGLWKEGWRDAAGGAGEGARETPAGLELTWNKGHSQFLYEIVTVADL